MVLLFHFMYSLLYPSVLSKILIVSNCGFYVKDNRDFTQLRKKMKLSGCNNLSGRNHILPYCRSNSKCLNGTIVNQTCHPINEGSHKIKSTICVYLQKAVHLTCRLTRKKSFSLFLANFSLNCSDF